MPKIKLDMFKTKYMEGPKAFQPYLNFLLKEITRVKKELLELNKVIKDRVDAAKKREKTIKKVKQFKFLIKINKGVSDALKAKCLPLNKQTQNVLAQQIKAVKEHSGFLGTCQTALEQPRLTDKVQTLAVKYYNDYVHGWDQFAKDVRAAMDAARKKETDATAILEKYLNEKKEMKKLGGDEYKQFKKEYTELAKNL